MIVGVPKETYPGERRVALVPAVISSLLKAGLDVVVETGAGEAAGYRDEDYVVEGREDRARASGCVQDRRCHHAGARRRRQRPDR